MAQYETSGSAKTLGNTLQLFRNVQRSAVNLVYSKSDDEEEDDEYLKVRSLERIAICRPCFLFSLRDMDGDIERVHHLVRQPPKHLPCLQDVPVPTLLCASSALLTMFLL